MNSTFNRRHISPPSLFLESAFLLIDSTISHTSLATFFSWCSFSIDHQPPRCCYHWHSIVVSLIFLIYNSRSSQGPECWKTNSNFVLCSLDIINVTCVDEKHKPLKQSSLNCLIDFWNLLLNKSLQIALIWLDTKITRTSCRT